MPVIVEFVAYLCKVNGIPSASTSHEMINLFGCRMVFLREQVQRSIRGETKGIFIWTCTRTGRRIE